MGSPLSSPLSDTPFPKLERTKVDSVIRCFENYYQYMDHIFCVTDATRDFCADGIQQTSRNNTFRN